MNQRAYADTLSVTPGYVSKRTADDGRLIRGTFDPFLDARFENGDPENGDLLGYTEPTDRSKSNEEVSPESARKAAGGTSNASNTQYGMGNQRSDQAGKSSDSEDRSAGRNQGSRRSQNRNRSHRVEGLENVFGSVGRAVAEDRLARNTLFRVIGAVGGAILAAKLVEQRAGPVLMGTALGWGLVEVSLQMEPTRLTPPNRARGLGLPSAYDRLRPGFGQNPD